MFLSLEYTKLRLIGDLIPGWLSRRALFEYLHPSRRLAMLVSRVPGTSQSRHKHGHLSIADHGPGPGSCEDHR